MSLVEERIAFKPFQYPWAYQSWKDQHNMHWLPEEVPLADDVKDWHHSLTPEERNLVTQIFRFFTQSDVEVNNCYMRHYTRFIKPPEVAMMLVAFSDMETIHIDAYSHLLDTIGMPETEYEAFLDYTEMKDKFDYMRSFDPKNPQEVAETMAAFGAFTEGVQLFASFAILMNFPRFNKLKGMGQIVTYSVRDETLHCLSMIRLFHEWVAEHPEIDRDKLFERITTIAKEIVEHEDRFIDLAFQEGPVQGLTPEEVKQYIRYVADDRLVRLGMDKLYNIDENPLPWMDSMLNSVEHAGFFEQRATEYTRNATQGTWGDVWPEDGLVQE
ncbi:ribonucleotide-diphosphate reductase subunit beta [Thalassospira xianhensis]|uniref:Ribonucleoside-diphosphate reductase subunit beta n=2 Tax=Thalassospira TaxID=168934 RepID=A0A285TTG4_9PROT|nr:MULTISPECIES: ribonucleotide-diphosphate reductase subunit beta [Thalassospira]RCK07810.1 ribonucleotide-diphosphate reductase subunit beta [Thalassospira xianhensis MCCC 1A02616]SOC27031.1 ribonucleoside-diphosphate reductase beta chain [Thalassospira xiamenensis]